MQFGECIILRVFKLFLMREIKDSTRLRETDYNASPTKNSAFFNEINSHSSKLKSVWHALLLLQEQSLILGINLLHLTHSIASTSFLRRIDQTCTQCSNRGLTTNLNYRQILYSTPLAMKINILLSFLIACCTYSWTYSD